MHYEWLDAYLLSFPGVEKDYQPVWQWFRYKVRGRLFAAVCSPGPEYKIYGGHDLVNLKCGAAEGELLHVAEINAVTGYIRGGCSPVGMKKQYPTVFHRTALDYETVYISAGKIGAQVELAPRDLLDLLGARAADIV